jgi:hypothetical protein
MKGRYTLAMPSGPFEGNTARPRASSGSDALQQLERGEISLEQYLELRVEKAIARLGDLVNDEERQILRETLRDHALVDPVIQELVRRATGRSVRPDPSMSKESGAQSFAHPAAPGDATAAGSRPSDVDSDS